MKWRFVLLLITLISTAAVSQAQGGPRPMRTVEERLKEVHHKIDSAFKLDAAVAVKVDTVFAKYYRAQVKLRDELIAASGDGRPDMSQFREKMQPLADARDNELKTLFTDEQYKKWKEEIEPSMSMRRNGGGGGNR